MRLNKVLFLIIPTLLTSCAWKNTDAKNYRAKLLECREEADFHTELYIFPEDTNEGTPTNFFYRKMEDLFIGTYVLYLVMEYDEVHYLSEIDRLSKVEARFSNGETKSIIHNVENSVYLTIQMNGRYEYAKYNPDKYEIAYVSNQLSSWEASGVSKEHLIDVIPLDDEDAPGGYNMYYYYVDDVGYYVTEEVYAKII